MSSKRCKNGESLKDRFSKTYTILENGCWQWIWATRIECGKRTVGTFDMGDRWRIRANRASWLIHIGGELTLEDNVIRSCENLLCVNPTHLSKVSGQTCQQWARVHVPVKSSIAPKDFEKIDDKRTSLEASDRSRVAMREKWRSGKIIQTQTYQREEMLRRGHLSSATKRRQNGTELTCRRGHPWEGQGEPYQSTRTCKICNWVNRGQPTTFACKLCGSAVTVQKMNGRKKFCSAACSAKYFTLPNTHRKCVRCGTTFSVNRHQKTKYCSGPCYWSQRRSDGTFGNI